MRWEQLFNELEAQTADIEVQERDALVEELRDGEWAHTSWRSLLGGAVVLDVLGMGRIHGTAVLVNNHVVQVRTEQAHHVISTAAVVAVISHERRAEPLSVVTSALGWGHVFRALRAEGESVQVCTINGSTTDGTIDVIGADFVRVRDEAGRELVIPFGLIAVVSGRR